jgi:RNA polymerase sigma-70 factor (ECF subfamily)
MTIDQDAPEHGLTAAGAGAAAKVPRTVCAPGDDDGAFRLVTGLKVVAPRASGRTPRDAQPHAHGFVPDALVVAHTRSSRERPIVAAAPAPRPLSAAQTGPRLALDAESRAWWERLHAPEPIRGRAIAELYERLRREATFHVRQRAGSVPGFPRSDIDDLATQAAGDALMALLRKLEDYRGDSQFWTWARRFAALEAPVSIRRRLGRDRVGISRNPDRAGDVADTRQSAHERAESRELLQSIARIMREDLTGRQRTVLTEIALNGTSTAALAERLDSTPGAIYKSLHDARLKMRAMAAQLQPVG